MQGEEKRGADTPRLIGGHRAWGWNGISMFAFSLFALGLFVVGGTTATVLLIRHLLRKQRIAKAAALAKAAAFAGAGLVLTLGLGSLGQDQIPYPRPPEKMYARRFLR